MEWPEHFPKACPPFDSVEADGAIFRVIKGDQPTESDFDSHWVRMPEKHKEWRKNGKACESCGLSVFTSIEEASMLIASVPSVGKKIAIANLDSNSGKLKHTPTSKHQKHYTWWLPIFIDKPWALFKVVA